MKNSNSTATKRIITRTSARKLTAAEINKVHGGDGSLSTINPELDNC